MYLYRYLKMQNVNKYHLCIYTTLFQYNENLPTKYVKSQLGFRVSECFALCTNSEILSYNGSMGIKLTTMITTQMSSECQPNIIGSNGLEFFSFADFCLLVKTLVG